jgi:two-component sensor histidine kinase
VYGPADGLAAWQVYRLFEDSHGDIWVSTVDAPTANGLARWEPESQRLTNLANSTGLPSLKEDVARSFGEDRSGNVWIGFNEALVRYANGRFTRFTAADGLPPGQIQDIHVDQSGRIWLASDQSGLVRVDQHETSRPVFAKYTTAQGLSGNSLEVITEDVAGRIFVGGGSGLDRLDPTTGYVKHFSVADGLTSGTIIAAFRDRRGVLWFGTAGGLTRLAPEAETPPTPPPIWITGVRATGVSKVISALGERALALPDLAADQRDLQIDFVALSFAPGEVLKYQYRLAGADWSAPSAQRSVTYARLSPGHYTFQVRAANSDGMISAPPATMTFTILRPVWLRAWFLALVACGLTATAYALYRYRVGRLLEVVNIRTRIASDLHDDVGANLTRIAILSEVARASSGADPAGGPLTSIARIARESVSSMSDIVWAIKPERESLLDLTRRMRQHGEELFTLRNIDFRFDAPTRPHDNLTLGVGTRRDVLLIFKEAINNAARHSGCSTVEVELRVEGSRLVMVILDNGEGFDASRETDGQGLGSMQRRARNVKGDLEIVSTIGTGTRIALTVPV